MCASAKAGLRLEEANLIVERTLAAGVSLDHAPLAAAVVDPVGEVIAQQRADGAHPMTSRIAVAKARTALVSGLPSGACEGLPLGIQEAARHLYGGDFVTRAGGMLILRGGECVGALGVSGAASEEDERAGVEALRYWSDD